MSVFAFTVANAAEEGRNIIVSMLVVGLVFLAVIALGEVNSWRSKRKMHRRASMRSY
jgi:heme/copper-type cytochrome/quinol oxidase subunit 2